MPCWVWFTITAHVSLPLNRHRGHIFKQIISLLFKNVIIFFINRNKSPCLFPQHQISISLLQCGSSPVDGAVRPVRLPCVRCPAKRRRSNLVFILVMIKCHLPLTQVSLSLLAFSPAPISPAPLSPLLTELPLHTKGGVKSSACAAF